MDPPLHGPYCANCVFLHFFTQTKGTNGQTNRQIHHSRRGCVVLPSLSLSLSSLLSLSQSSCSLVAVYPFVRSANFDRLILFSPSCFRSRVRSRVRSCVRIVFCSCIRSRVCSRICSRVCSRIRFWVCFHFALAFVLAFVFAFALAFALAFACAFAFAFALAFAPALALAINLVFTLTSVSYTHLTLPTILLV